VQTKMPSARATRPALETAAIPPAADLLAAGVVHACRAAAYRCRMDVIELLPRLRFIRFPAGHAYLWHDRDGLTLLDTGLPGSAPLIADAIRQSGYQPADLRRLVLTHFHADHIGAAADIADWGEVEVLAHHADAPFIRAGAAGPAPDLADWERPIYQQVTSQLPAEPVIPPRIDREIEDGDELSFGDGAVAVAVPGHTPGSVALYLPRHQVLFTGDAVARGPDGKVICGVFNVNRTQAAASLRRLADLDATVACFGHGEPLTRAAAAELQAAVRHLPSDTGQHARDVPVVRRQRQLACCSCGVCVGRG
jgi:glyoxylase-like metal-dependent hydrolase (beta-lactamase superfamily II)